MNARLLPAALILVFAAGCSSTNTPGPSSDMDAIATAVANIDARSNSSVDGTVTFAQHANGSVHVVADLTGLTPGQKHAMHVHENGDCSAADATSAGGHYNPEGHAHGLPPAEPRHAGDLGNVTADAAGKAHYEITVSNLTIKGAKNPIDGKSVIVHAAVDDGGQPVGNAGGRIGCGVIAAR